MTHKQKPIGKLISTLLAAALAFAMLPATAFAAQSDAVSLRAQDNQIEQTSDSSADQANPGSSDALYEGTDNALGMSEGDLDQATAEQEAESSFPDDNLIVDTATDVESLLNVEPAQLDGEYASDQVIIVYEDDFIDSNEPIEVDGPDATVALTDLGVEQQEVIVADEESQKTGDIAIAQLDDEASVELAVAQISQLPGVLYAQPNYTYYLSSSGDGTWNEETVASFAAEANPVPLSTNDTYYSSQYYLQKSNISPAWRTVQASNGVTVAVIDSGCYLSHPDLKPNLLTNLAWDCVSNASLSASSVQDTSGHGTQVCGIIAAKANNSQGVAGVSYNANIIPLKVFASGDSTSSSYVVSGLKKVAEYAKSGSARNLKVVNMSLGMYADDPFVHMWIQTLYNQYGITVVCAGGNGDENGKPITDPCYPSDYEECISVTSLTQSGTHSTWCDYNAAKDISAPGEYLWTTTRSGSYSNSGVIGTSFSSPLVAGVVALMVAAKPSATPSEIYNAIRASATPVPGASRPNDGSAGAINAVGALAKLGVNTAPSYYKDLDFTVDYDAPVKCGTPTTFTVNAVGGSSSYKYMFDTIWLKDSENYYVKDPSRGKGYVTSNTFEFTFMASGTYSLEFYVMDIGSGKWNTVKKAIQVVVNDAAAYPDLDTKVKQIVSECTKAGNSTDYQKALWLHDWIVNNCKYDNSLIYCNAEGALARGLGTCEAYHRAYVRLLTEAGIESGRITGNGHVWTAVNMEGNWYQVDVTWDDPGYESSTYPNLQHMYFGLNDELMQMVHPAHKPTAPYVSDSLDCNYFIKSGKIETYSEPFETDIQSQLNNGKVSFSLPVPTTGWAATEIYRKIIYSLAAYDLSGKNFDFNGNEIGFDVQYSNNNLVFNSTFFGSSGPVSQGWKTGEDGQWYYVKADGSLHKGWLQEGNSWYYLDSDTGAMRTGLQQIDGKSYFFRDAPNGSMATGWVQIGDDRYYFAPAPNGAMQKGWIQVGQSRFYTDPNTGIMKTGWLTVGGSTYYLLSSGEMYIGFGTIGGKNYAFDGAGRMIKGWYYIAGANRYFTQDGSAAVGDVKVNGKDSCFKAGGIPMKGWFQRSEYVRYYFDDDGAYHKEWLKEGNDWYYLDPFTYVMRTDWISVGDSVYYFSEDGKMFKGWQNLDGEWRYYSDSGEMKFGWLVVSGNRYYLHPDTGIMQTGLQEIDGKAYLFRDAPNGSMATGLHATSQGTYRFLPEGGTATGWVNEAARWYYLDPEDGGRAATGWKDVGAHTYRFDDAGRMLTGWAEIDGSWHYFAPAPSGAMQRGWLLLGGHWYYLDAATGAMLTGLQEIGGKSYLFRDAPNGSMVTGWAEIDGEWHYFAPAPSGAMQRGWLQLGASRFYLDPDTGAMLTGLQEIGGKSYLFRDAPNGSMVTGWAEIDGSWHYFAPAPSGAMQRGWLQLGASRFYLDPDTGAMLTGLQEIGGKSYLFRDAPNGSMVTGRAQVDGKWYYFESDGTIFDS